MKLLPHVHFYIFSRSRIILLRSALNRQTDLDLSDIIRLREVSYENKTPKKNKKTGGKRLKGDLSEQI